jgi:DNA-3-methyladenine glycosylase I
VPGTSKREGIRDAFAGFDVEAVAAMGPDDVDRPTADRRVIRNRRKIEGIVDNAARMLELDGQPGGFAGYLKSHPDFEATVADLKHNFKFLGDTSAHFFLAAVDEPVATMEEGAFAHHRGHKA